jgi:hypothetical protein
MVGFIILGLGPDHIFVWLGPALPTPPALSGFPACNCVGPLLHWEPMRQCLVTKATELF